MKKQFSLFGDSKAGKAYNQTTYGGETVRGKRKTARPFAAKKWTHIVLKSDIARHNISLCAGSHRITISHILREKARQFGVLIGDAVIMPDHVHIKACSSSRVCFQRFLRTITGCIARTLTGAKRGSKFGSFWRELAYTRVLKTFKEILYLTGYFTANRIERDQGYAAREEHLKLHREFVAKQNSKYASKCSSNEGTKYSPAEANTG